MKEIKENYRILYSSGEMKNQGQHNQVGYYLEMDFLFDFYDYLAAFFSGDLP
jgi:hypothetical protein